MKNVEWFSRTTWSDADRQEFDARLRRSRGDGSKAQYLRIQAVHLAEAGLHVPAVELLDRMLSDFPDTLQLAQAHSQKANSLAKLGKIEQAIHEFRTALQAQRDFPNFRTNAWLNFGWFVLENNLTDLFAEISNVMQEFWDESGMEFPLSAYRYLVIQSLLADDRGDTLGATEFARRALSEAQKDHSGFRRHPNVGLVGIERNTFASRLEALAGAPRGLQR
jgi:tetratricopeptide (TPR) repeat protein